MSRTLDTAPIKTARCFSASYYAQTGCMAVEQGKLTNNTSRVLHFLNDSTHRRDTMRLVDGNAKLSGPKAELLAREKGCQMWDSQDVWMTQENPSPLAIRIVASGQRIGWIVGDIDGGFVKVDSDLGHLSF